jgi:Domain of unknown function (DUF4389)
MCPKRSAIPSPQPPVSGPLPYDVRMPYPVSVAVEPLLAPRDRLTTAFRLILAIPHLILVGGIGFSMAFRTGRNDLVSLGPETGLLGLAAGILAIVSWFTILISREHILGIRQYTRFYLRWRVRAVSYLMLLEDQYPPFGDAPYPASVTIVDPVEARDRVTVGFRILLAIPHFIALAFLLTAWWITTVVAWFLILFTGRYPQGLYGFGVGALQWLIRVEAYMLLMIDEYPPFSLE